MAARAPIHAESAVGGDSLNIALIRRDLWSETFARHLYLFAEVPSTNEVLRGLAKEGAREGTVVIAEAQSAGRGRQGKPWFSPPGLNVYASILLRPALAVRAVPVFSFIASLALTEAIWLEGLPAAIKWPNDVVVDRKKVAGTLAECASTGDRLDYLILGVGVNLNVSQAELQKALGAEAEGATSLAEVAGHELDRNRFTAAFLNLLEKWLLVHRRHGAEPVLQAWRERDVLTGRRVLVAGNGGRGPQRVLGVNHGGHLVVEDPAGEVHEVVSGEIRLVD